MSAQLGKIALCMIASLKLNKLCKHRLCNSLIKVVALKQYVHI